MDEPLRFRRARVALALGLSLGLAGAGASQEVQVESPPDPGAEYLVDTTSEHLQQRSARYRWGVMGRLAQDEGLEGVGAGLFLQGPDWFRDVDMVSEPDPKLAGHWRVTITSHDLDLRDPPVGAAALQGEEVLMLSLGFGGEYFFKRQFRQLRDENGRPKFDRFGDPVVSRQNTPFLATWLESFHFLETRGTQPSTQDSEGAFNNTAVGVTLGLGYQIEGRMRFGVEHSFIGGPTSSSQVYLGSSF